MGKLVVFFIGIFLSFIVPRTAFAHEAYVLTKQEFSQGLLTFTKNPLAPLIDASHLNLFLIIAAFVIASRIIILLLDSTPLSPFLDKQIRKASEIGPVIIRVAMGLAFFYAAQANVVFGPEISLNNYPESVIIRFTLFVIAIMSFFGFLTQIAAGIGMIIFFYFAAHLGIYIATYTNVLGELLVLLLFGSRFLSIDQFLFKRKLFFVNFEKFRYLETPLVRIFYGIALLFSGITIKFLHQNISIAVYNEYHLGNFFHAGGDFIAAGAGLSEVLIGLFMIIGFSMRWTLAFTLFFMTLSIWYFRELVWPHFILYGITLALFINAGDVLTLDHYLKPLFSRIKKRLLHINNR